MGSKADVLLARGRIQEAKELSDAALPRARSVRDPQMLIPALITAAGIDVALGVRSEIAREIPGATPRAVASYHLPGAVRALVQIGALDETRDFLEGIIATTTRSQIGMLTSRALVQEAAGNHEEAAPLHAESARRWAEFGFPYEQARSLMGAAVCLVSLDRADEALGPLTEASRILSGLGALPLLGEVSSLLEQAEAAASGSR
jgi:tetratricopeptide (TPR) repeat protein